MINKLKNKVSLIILFAISFPFILLLFIYDLTYYNNTVRFNSSFIDRFFMEPKNDNRRIYDNEMIEINGVYSIVMNNNEIIKTSNNITEDIKNKALKVSGKNTESGIVGDYIYKKRSRDMKNSETTVILIESKDEIKKIKLVIGISIITLITGLVLIYFLSKKIASLLIKPVSDTFKKQKEFISDASHELKTPLAVIQANSDVLEGEIGNNKWLTYIQNETDNMNKLINELLLLTRIENIDELRKPEKFNISDHISIIVSSFESMAYEKKVKIETNIEDGIVLDRFNKDDIEHILSTLIDNAIKHTKNNKKVIIEFKKNKEAIEMNVKNYGEEIPVSERDRIFDRFYRIDKSRNRDEKRYGLGLSIAKSTVEKNKGQIVVDYKDGYTIFNVRLPL